MPSYIFMYIAVQKFGTGECRFNIFYNVIYSCWLIENSKEQNLIVI